MQPWLRRLAEVRGDVKLSFKRGRRGWLISSSLSLELLRARLCGFVTRVCAVHAPSGRYFLEPAKSYHSVVLSHQELTISEQFLTARRRERLRRLEPFLRVGCGSLEALGENGLFSNLALRLERVGQDRDADKLWDHLGRDFDVLWEKVPLFSLPLTRFQVVVLRALMPTRKG